MDECTRIINPTTNTEIPKGWISIRVSSEFISPEAATVALEQVKKVMSAVATASARTAWLSDKEWRRQLPDWLISSFHEYTPEELQQYLKDKVTLGWDFASWLEAIKDRTWRWWGEDFSGKIVTITLLVDGWPYSLGAFTHLWRAAGAKAVREEEIK